MQPKTCTIGLDIGSTAVSGVLLSADATVLSRFYQAHNGDIPAALRQLDKQFEAQRGTAVRYAVTGRTAATIDHDLYVESRMACIRSAKERYPHVRAILQVGAEFFSLIRLDRDGRYESIRTNTSCAAGTGGFLDQQAGRLQMRDSAELSSTAVANTDPCPLVATRCAVFAKTDLIHAQQEGYSLSSIASGLCSGLAGNLVDTLFKDEDLAGPVLFTGGVSRNTAVVQAVKSRVPQSIIVDEDGPFQGALGAAYTLHQSLGSGEVAQTTGGRPDSAAARYRATPPDRSNFYPPLELQLSEYPDFRSYKSYEQALQGRPGQPTVEVDLYRSWGSVLDAYLGIDIGSTSTKAVLTDTEGCVYGGFYTRTSGRPLEAVQALFEAIAAAAATEGCSVAVHGTATTGSGRKFVAGIIGADEILDEISAHARAACELDPKVDTILEIGGQDAKFSTLRNGRVTLSVMNNVCAAGTGSFIEEQAKRLGVDVRAYAELTNGVAAPRVSDRCTVFMERDMNHLLSEGHSTQEVLAAGLHAVRENYLQKVAVERSIGEVVFFQGATAKNRSLVAAFEQRLNRPILVSPYCHLTGALGAALTLRDEQVFSDAFVGLDLWRREVPLRREVCTVCANHCKLSVAELGDKSVAFGFLCGRDYDTQSYVSRDTAGFNLVQARRRLDRRLRGGAEAEAHNGDMPVIGLPVALYVSEDILYWQTFFDGIGLATRTDNPLKDDLRLGKQLAGAEFCAPISALHGRAAALLEKVDYLFLPNYIERKPDGSASRKFCYFSQYASAMVGQAVGHEANERIIAPLAASRQFSLHLVRELHKALEPLGAARPSLRKVHEALEKADELRRRRDEELVRLYMQNRRSPGGLDVVLLGRPYSVLVPEMNKGIPELFGRLGVRAFYQDMIPYQSKDTEAVHPLLEEINWSYGAQMLEVAEAAARTRGLYPVLLSSFKCGPDSFLVEYVRRVLDAHDKPYLVLELDEHDSAVGYETRIEAAVRSFRNHHENEQAALHSPVYTGVNPRYVRELSKDKTLVLPNWDDHAIPLIAAILNGQGYPTVIMQETEQSIRTSLRWNNGQCTPMNALVEGYVDTIHAHGLNPAQCLLWVPSAEFSCNIKLFAHHIQEILHTYGHGMEQAGVYLGQMTYIELSPVITANAYLAYMFSGLIRRIACRIRPYEHNPGQTDAAVKKSLLLLEDVFKNLAVNKAQVVREVMQLFGEIPYDTDRRKPQVALFGDVYVRDNPVFNQDVVGYIEHNGGEVVTMPFHEFTRMTVETYFRRWFRNGYYGRLLALKPMMAALAGMERWYYRHFEPLIGEPAPRFRDDAAEVLKPYGVLLDHEGESQDNLLKTWYISRQYPDLSLFVQLNPGFCCAGLVTEAMSRKVREITGVPVLSITYDGTGGLKNDAILPYLKYPQVRTGTTAQGEPAVG